MKNLIRLIAQSYPNSLWIKYCYCNSLLTAYDIQSALLSPTL